MQKKLLPAFLLLLSSSAIAQPTITSLNNPVNGDVFTYYNCDSIGPGAGGANVTWNFSGLNSTSSAAYTFQSCPGAPDCGTFPGSNLALPSGATGAYYIADVNRFAWNGEKGGGINFIYSDPRDVRRYPSTMNDTYTDTHASQFTSGTTFSRMGTISSTVDGYGTLQLPNGTFTNVLRTHYTDAFTDSSHILSTMTNNYERDVYEWHKQGSHEYLLHIEVLTNYAGGLNPFTWTIGTVIYTANTTGIDDLQAENANIRIYPVPVRGQLNVTLSLKAETIELTDITGRPILKMNCTSGKDNYTINTDNIPAGIYLVRIETEKGAITRKVEIL